MRICPLCDQEARNGSLYVKLIIENPAQPGFYAIDDQLACLECRNLLAQVSLPDIMKSLKTVLNMYKMPSKRLFPWSPPE